VSEYVKLLIQSHEQNLPLYAAVTVFSMAAVGSVLAGLIQAILRILKIRKGNHNHEEF
jgi:hypothetical protein